MTLNEEIAPSSAWEGGVDVAESGFEEHELSETPEPIVVE